MTTWATQDLALTLGYAPWIWIRIRCTILGYQKDVAKLRSHFYLVIITWFDELLLFLSVNWWFWNSRTSSTSIAWRSWKHSPLTRLAYSKIVVFSSLSVLQIHWKVMNENWRNFQGYNGQCQQPIRMFSLRPWSFWRFLYYNCKIEVNCGLLRLTVVRAPPSVLVFCFYCFYADSMINNLPK